MPSKASDAALAAMRAEHEQASKVVLKPETPKERFKRFLTLEMRIEAGERVMPGERQALEEYQSQPEYRSYKMVFEDFSWNMFG